MHTLLAFSAFTTLALAAKNTYYNAGEYAPCLNQQQQQQRPQPQQLARGPVALSPSCQQSNLPPARLLDWPSMRAAYALLSDNQLPAARLACDSAECAVIVVNARILVAHVVSGVPRRLCSGMMELCQQQVANETSTVESASASTETATATATGCPVSATVCSATVSQGATAPSVSQGATVSAPNSMNTTSQFAIVNITAPYYMARAVCSRLGMTFADVTIQNFLPAVDTVLQCVGQRQRAWVASWNGDAFGNQTCLALTVGDQSGGGAINPVANCTEPLPVLCQIASQQQPQQPSCADSDYAVVQGVAANDTAAACSAISMYPVDVTPANARAVSRALLNCPALHNQTAWVSSYQQQRRVAAVKAVECGCLGVVAVAPGRLVAVRPLFQCQCAELRAVLCGRTFVAPASVAPSSAVSVAPTPVAPSVTAQPQPQPQQNQQQPQGYGATIA